VEAQGQHHALLKVHLFGVRRVAGAALCALLAALACALTTAPAHAANDCGSRFPGQVAAGYPADVRASGVSCRAARIVAATCSLSDHVTSDHRCVSQGRRWHVRSHTLRHGGVPVGTRTVCTSGRRTVAFSSIADD
jgi:hypothetical protein